MFSQSSFALIPNKFSTRVKIGSSLKSRTALTPLHGFFILWYSLMARLKEEDRLKIISQYESGESISNIAKIHNLDIRQVSGLICYRHKRKKYPRVPNGYWKDWDNIEKHLKELMADNHGLIPTKLVFWKAGLSGLNTAITEYWGGLEKIRKQFGVDGLKYCSQCEKVKNRDDGFRNRSRD